MSKVFPVIEVRDLHKSFDSVEVLKGIDFEVQRGKIISIIGSSGSGKSTLLRCMNWLEQPDSGSIRIIGDRIGISEDGKTPMTEKELASLRARMAMVFQGFNLWPHLSVLQNVTEAPIHVQGVEKGKAIAQAEVWLDRVGMLIKKDAYPFTLSGGQKQRVAIARGLAMNPEVILFDEPTSALDPELVGEVQDVIGELAKDNFTMVIVTHEMDFAQSISNEVVFIDKGVVVEQAPPEKFFNKPETERLKQFLGKYK
jgi:polar amino acid transport system ATP-binding protein